MSSPPEIAVYADRLDPPAEFKTAMMGPSGARDFAKAMAEGEQISKTVAEYWNSH